jgi:hypothetical protein
VFDASEAKMVVAWRQPGFKMYLTSVCHRPTSSAGGCKRERYYPCLLREKQLVERNFGCLSSSLPHLRLFPAFSCPQPTLFLGPQLLSFSCVLLLRVSQGLARKANEDPKTEGQAC